MSTPRYNLDTYNQGDDNWSHTDTVEFVDEHSIGRGPVSERPTSGNYDDEFYYATDQNVLWSWDESITDWIIRGGTGSEEQPLDSVHTEKASIDNVAGKLRFSSATTVEILPDTQTKIPWNVVDFEQTKVVEGNDTDATLTVKEDGIYQIATYFVWSQGTFSAGDRIITNIFVNGARNRRVLQDHTGNGVYISHIDSTLQLSADDVVDIRAIQNSGETQELATDSPVGDIQHEFSVRRLG